MHRRLGLGLVLAVGCATPSGSPVSAPMLGARPTLFPQQSGTTRRLQAISPVNDQVAWDSEYYLSIALGGYDDPYSPHFTPQGVITSPEGIQPTGIDSNTVVSSNYAFFPFYPLVIRILALPIRLFGLNPIAAATLAGILTSAIGTLGGMLALYELTPDK